MSVIYIYVRRQLISHDPDDCKNVSQFMKSNISCLPRSRQCSNYVIIISLRLVCFALCKWDKNSSNGDFGHVLRRSSARRLTLTRGAFMMDRIPEECTKEVADFIDRCLSTDTGPRPTAKEVLCFLAQQILKRAESDVAT